MTHDLDQSSPATLARLMDLEAAPNLGWAPAEYAAVLAHQLAAPLTPDLAGTDPELEAKVARLSHTGAGPIQTLHDLLGHPQPPLELLDFAKRFLKAASRQQDGPLPSEVATFLYYAVLAAALVRRGTRITQLADAELRTGFTWALAQPWGEAQLQGLLRDATAVVGEAAKEQ